jgi:hypothetical protein
VYCINMQIETDFRSATRRQWLEAGPGLIALSFLQGLALKAGATAQTGFDQSPESWRQPPVGPASGQWIDQPALATGPNEAAQYLQQWLAPPPSPGTAAQAQDLQTLQKIAQYNDAALRNQAIALEPMGFWQWVFWSAHQSNTPSARAMPQAWQEPLPPLLATFFRQIRNDFEPVLLLARRLYPRPRPPELDSSLIPAWPVGKNNSYPSAKVWSFFMQAQLLADIEPRFESMLAQGKQALVSSRTVSLVHYPSDVAAAKQAAVNLAKHVMDKPLYRSMRPSLLQEAQGFF